MPADVIQRTNSVVLPDTVLRKSPYSRSTTPVYRCTSSLVLSAIAPTTAVTHVGLLA
jgi:hypothetical protein